ncbi:hypothetical protein F4779DRAFT_582480 [Xylariaceae sp. FL0662B]|nr:hypothetical protein F4779DRAFT_582480 [Xylariaceae sp. FL0662B]
MAVRGLCVLHTVVLLVRDRQLGGHHYFRDYLRLFHRRMDYPSIALCTTHLRWPRQQDDFRNSAGIFSNFCGRWLPLRLAYRRITRGNPSCLHGG